MAKLKQHHLALLHTAPRSLGIDDTQRRTVQRNVGGFESAADMDFPALAKVLAFWESRGWKDSRRGTHHWRKLAERADLLPMENKIMKLADVLGWTNYYGRVDFKRLNGFVRRMTKRKDAALNNCDGQELWKIIEALKVMVDRAPETTK